MDRTDFERKVWERVGHRIKVMRVDHKLHQKDLAEAVGMLQSQLSLIETGQRPVRIDQLLLIAKTLNCRIADLVTDAEKLAA